MAKKRNKDISKKIASPRNVKLEREAAALRADMLRLGFNPHLSKDCVQYRLFVLKNRAK